MVAAILLAVGQTSAQDRIDLSAKQIGFSATAFTKLPFGEVKRLVTEKPIRIDGLKIVRNRHVLVKPVIVRSTELCGIVSGVEIAVADEGLLYRVQDYVSYKFGGKVFAYEVDYELIDRESGEEIGATTAAFYVDVLGRGTFGIRCVKDFKLDAVPEWIRNLSRQD